MKNAILSVMLILCVIRIEKKLWAVLAVLAAFLGYD
jgi:hypothetical protein